MSDFTAVNRDFEPVKKIPPKDGISLLQLKPTQKR
jgi:hypothetical protein